MLEEVASGALGICMGLRYIYPERKKGIEIE